MNISISSLFQNSRKGTKKTAQIQIFFLQNFQKAYMPTKKNGKNPVFIGILRIKKHT